MSKPRAGATGTVLPDGRVLVAGGTVKAGYWDTASAELYDPATNSWSPAAEMAHARMFHDAVALADGRVLVLGDAANGNDLGATGLAEIYDPAANRWTPAAPMPLARGDAAVTRLRDGRVLYAGGIDTAAAQHGGHDVELATADVYDPATDRWTPTGALHDTRFDAGAATLPDGRVLVAGGAHWAFNASGPSNGQTAKTTAELLDPESLTWTPTGSLKVPRGEGATLVTTAVGTPLFLGGRWGTYYTDGTVTTSHSQPESSVEAFDAATGTWHFMASMDSKRDGHTALTLANGTLLAFGGSSFPEGSERLVPLPPPVAQNPTTSPQPTPTPTPPVAQNPATSPQPTATPTPAAPRAVAGKLSFAKPLPNRLKPSRTRTITVKLRCTGGPCRDRLALRRATRTLARVDVKAAASATVTVKLKVSTANYRKLRHRKTPATLVLSKQGTTLWVTVTS
jgi:hypothetical protein